MHFRSTVLILTTLLIPLANRAVADEKGERTGEEAKPLVGTWDGGANDWGEIKVRVAKTGYTGTYSATYNGQLGHIKFGKTDKGIFVGEWSESDLKRHGTLELTVSRDGQSIQIKWKALDNDQTKAKERMSTWTRKKS